MSTPTITLTTIQQQLTAWLAASIAVSEGQSYSINGRQLTRAQASEIRDSISYWQSLEATELRRLNGQGSLSVKLAKF